MHKSGIVHHLGVDFLNNPEIVYLCYKTLRTKIEESGNIPLFFWTPAPLSLTPLIYVMWVFSIRVQKYQHEAFYLKHSSFEGASLG